MLIPEELLNKHFIRQLEARDKLQRQKPKLQLLKIDFNTTPRRNKIKINIFFLTRFK